MIVKNTTNGAGKIVTKTNKNAVHITTTTTTPRPRFSLKVLKKITTNNNIPNNITTNDARKIANKIPNKITSEVTFKAKETETNSITDSLYFAQE